MSRRSGPPRRGRALWTVLAACALSAAPAAGAAAPGDHVATRAPAQARVPVAHVDPDPDPAPVGGNVTVHILLANRGPDRTVTPFTVTVALPDNTTATGPFFPDSCLADPLGLTVTCTFPGGLNYLRTAIVNIPAQISASAPPNSKLRDGSVTVTNPDDPDAKVRTVKFAIRTV
ncbi:hypothetical protein [Kitasatospora sp. GP82]|uniref:hypothetical protein n=1 Tax=Kitasatospora sp. GP82 TaxID=3035089 RepID=UPI00247424E4|nr:hypothetical protein [Kitasatospora sp. GP82]MDH6129500.1 hypothetical protein [Kitasatospora sp. GP82]